VLIYLLHFNATINLRLNIFKLECVPKMFTERTSTCVTPEKYDFPERLQSRRERRGKLTPSLCITEATKLSSKRARRRIRRGRIRRRERERSRHTHHLRGEDVETRKRDIYIYIYP